MIKDNTFSLEDLDDTFWNKVIFIEIQHSSGLGGPGCLWLITSEPKLYYIGFDEFPYSEQRLGDFHPFFERITDVNQEHNSHLKLEELGFVKHSQDNVYVKEKYYKSYCREWDEKARGNHYVHAPNVMEHVLGVDTIERFDWVVSAKKQKELLQSMKQANKEKKKRELPEESFKWYPLFDNNSYSECCDESGWYCLILKEVDKKVAGYRFTIVYQREEISPLVMKGFHAPIEKYILMKKYYDDVIGRLRYPNPQETDGSWEEYILTEDVQNTLNDMDLNNSADFIRAFDSLEEAKNYAIEVVNRRNYVNKENVILEKQLDDLTRINDSLERKYNAIVMLKKYIFDIVRFISEYEYPTENESGGVVFIAAERLGIDIELMQEMWQYIPMELLPRTQRKAEKILKNIRSGEHK